MKETKYSFDELQINTSKSYIHSFNIELNKNATIKKNIEKKNKIDRKHASNDKAEKKYTQKN